MPEIPRAQVVATLVVGLVVVVLGVGWIRAQGGPAAAGGGAGGPAVAHGAGGGQGEGDGVLVGRGSGADAVVVHVAGAVRSPGVYRLRGEARVRDAVRRAGGATRRGDANAINLAAKVADGQQVVVPARAGTAAAAAATPVPGATTAPPSGPVNLNTATREQLDTLEGVGPATAQKILDYRQEHGGFASVDDLAQIPGIGPKRLAALRDKVQV